MIRRILARLLDPGLERAFRDACKLAAAHIELGKQARATALADVAAILNCGATLAEIDEAVRGLQEDGAGYRRVCSQIAMNVNAAATLGQIAAEVGLRPDDSAGILRAVKARDGSKAQAERAEAENDRLRAELSALRQRWVDHEMAMDGRGAEERQAAKVVRCQCHCHRVQFCGCECQERLRQ